MSIRARVAAAIASALVVSACSAGGAAPSTTVPQRESSVATSVATTSPTTTAPSNAGSSDLGFMASSAQRVERPADTNGVSALVAGNQAFAADLYAAFSSADDANLALSPLSIRIALAMVYAGASGSTASQMASALGFGAFGADPHAAFNALDAALATRDVSLPPGPDGVEPSVQLEIANALWVQNGFDLESPFLDTLASEYGAGVNMVDFISDAARARLAINTWVADATNDRIPELIGANVLTDLTRLVLTNAVLLDASWAMPFDPDMTSPAPFTLPDGSVVDAEMMRDTRSILFAEGDGWQAIELPYVGDDLAMLLVVPDVGSFDAIEARLGDFVGGLEMNPARVALALPRFQFRSQLGVVDALRGLGMTDAFDRGLADFSGMTGGRDLFISDVLHETFVSVDEAGTEAAAATAVIIDLRSAVVGDPIVLEIDRPFFFVLRDRVTGAVLFLGRVTDPTA